MVKEERKKIGIVTDSIGDIPDEITAKYGIEVVPVRIHVDEKTFLDKIEITDEEFFKLIEESNVHAKTSQPSPYDFEMVYKKMLPLCEQVISIHASSELSGTFQSAVLAKESLGGDGARVTLVDTRQASMGEGMMVMRAAEMIQEGHDVPAIAKEMERISGAIKTRFVPDTLTYLQRGGRIGKASAFVGNILNIKPLLGVDKIVYPVEKVRGSKNVVPKLIEQLKESLKPTDSYIACILSSNMPEDAAELEKQVKTDRRLKKMVHAKVGATIGCHVGPKVIGLIWYTL